jgi:hypothetical protein
MLSADDGVHAVAYDAVTIHVLLQAEGLASGNDFVVRFPALAGRVYQLEESTDLSATSWTNLSGNIGGSGLVQYPVINALSQPRRFYRVKVLP